MTVVIDEIRMKLVGGGIPVPENLIDLDQSSVDMPPPPMIAPLKQLERLFGESVLPLISYAPFNESCSRFCSSAGSRHGENRTVEYTTGTKPGEYRIAREVSAGRQFDVWENARLFALVNLAIHRRFRRQIQLQLLAASHCHSRTWR